MGITIMTNSIITEEAVASTENKEEVHEEEEHAEEEEKHEDLPEHVDEVDVTEPENKGNILDATGIEDIKALGFEDKIVLTKAEMKMLFEKTLLKEEIEDQKERDFYVKMIENVMKEIPEEVKKEDVKTWFEIPFLMKHVDKADEAHKDWETPEEEKKTEM